MRLYHYSKISLLFLVLLLLGAGCGPTGLSPSNQDIQVEVLADGGSQTVTIPAGSKVEDVLQEANITLEGKDRVEPAPSSLLEVDSTVEVIRVQEEFETEEEVIPFQVIRQPSESLPEGEEQLLQAGKNGVRQVTHVRVIENGEEVSYEEVNSVVVQEPVDEIVLVGMQSSVSPLTIPGRLVYLSDGNAWMMQGSTSNRSLVVSTGDLDGRVFSLSDDGSWLLFTRREEGEDVINSLWAANIDQEARELVDLETENIIHFGAWAPGSVQEVAYSTVESRVSSPGWQANNDLQALTFEPNGFIQRETLVETNYGGVYGWWGTTFLFREGQSGFAFASPDRVGLIADGASEKQTLLDILPYKTRGDWAWMPGIGLGPNGAYLFTVEHVPLEGAGSAEESPVFNLVAVGLSGGRKMTLGKEVGMFAYPLPSPRRSTSLSGEGYQVAYLQAVFPRQSANSKYRITVMDRDGSNKERIFPTQEESGIEPSRNWGVWAPAQSEEKGNRLLAVLYQGNIHVVNPDMGESWPVTGDGRVQRMDWK